ncbi:MAG: DUF6753 family protein [Phormidesmis sp.]
MSLQSRSRKELISEALEGQSDEVKARVLAIVIRYNVDVRNEFFLIFVAIGHLLAIVEEAPENWRALFDAFEEKLDAWSERNLKILAAIQQQGEAAERMSQSFLKLTDSLKLSTTKTGELQQDLIKLSKTLQTLSGSLDSLNDNSKALASRFSRTEKSIADNQKYQDRSSLFNYGVMLLLLGSLLAIGWQQFQQSERIGWLVEKANREECLTGFRLPDDPLCAQYQR